MSVPEQSEIRSVLKLNKEFFTTSEGMPVESKRLIFRKITDNDFAELCEMLKDAEVMYAWEHAFNDDEVNAWIKKRMALYDIYGYDYFLAVDKRTSKVVGQIGLLDEVVGEKHYIGLAL